MDNRDDFFVGYLPTPTNLQRTLRAMAILLVIGLIICGALIAAGQRDPGTGKWEDSTTETLGALVESPYPMLQTDHGLVLVVDQGKVGAAERIRGMHGKQVKIRGTRIERNEFKLVELAEDPDAITENGAPSRIASPIASDSATLHGEIIDPKCHSGAMKPGDGKTHKACAVLCIRGGIPPVFVDDAGTRFVLVDETDHALTGDALEAILPFVGDRVEIHGTVLQLADLKLLRINADSVRRTK